MNDAGKTREQLIEELEELRGQVAELEVIYRHAPVGIGYVDRELRFRRINERLAAMNGRPVADHIGVPIREVLPGLADRIEESCRQLLETGEPVIDQEITTRMPADPRRRVTCLVNRHLVRDAEGRIQGIISVVRDITPLKRMLHELEAVRARLDEAQRVARLGSWEWDIVEDRVWWSPQLYRLLGHDRLRYIPSFEGFVDMLHPDDRPKFRRQLDATFKQDEPYDIELRVIRPDTRQRLIHACADLVRLPDGTPSRLVGTVRDVTAERRAEEAATSVDRYDPK